MPLARTQFFRTIDLTDTAISNPTDGQVLSWDASLERWINSTVAPGGVSSLSALDDVTITSLGDGEVLVSASGDWINQTLAEAGIAAATHTHAAADTTSGTFADARISQSSVTQHEAALSITESQISDLGNYVENLSSFSTSDLAEGTNLYFTAERVDDRVAALLVAGTDISLSYDDGAGTLTINSTVSAGSSTLAGLSDVTVTSVADNEVLQYDSSSSQWINQTLSEAGIAAASHTHAASAITSGILPVDRGGTGFGLLPAVTNYTGGATVAAHLSGINSALGDKIEDLSGFTTTDLAEGTNLYFTNERVDDRVSSLIQAGTGISWSYDDGAGTLTPTISLASFSTSNLSEGSNLYFTEERVDDRVAALLVEGSNISLTYDDGAGTLTIASTAGGGGASNLADLDDVTVSSVGDGELLVYDNSTSDWINRTLAEAGVAATTHTHAASDTTSGTFADARISESSVTQHEAALSITESQISDLGSYYSSGDTILAADGTVSLPGISFSADTNTGIFRSGNDSMQITLGGTPVASFVTFFGIRTFTWDANIQQFNASSTLNFACPSVNVSHSNSALAGVVNLREATANGTNNISLQSPASLSANWTLTLPSDDGDANELLLTDGSGTTSWSKVAEASLDTALADKINSVKLSYLIETPADQDYPVELYIPVVATLQTIYVKTASGTCTLNVKLDGTSVTGWSAISVTSTESSTAASGANVTTVGQTLVLTISSTSSADMLSVTIVGEL